MTYWPFFMLIQLSVIQMQNKFVLTAAHLISLGIVTEFPSKFYILCLITLTRVSYEILLIFAFTTAVKKVSNR